LTVLELILHHLYGSVWLIWFDIKARNDRYEYMLFCDIGETNHLFVVPKACPRTCCPTLSRPMLVTFPSRP